MKNILIISSSPRKKGNSQILCEQFKKGAEAKGHQVKIVRIMEQNIGFCRACDGCMRNGGTCVLKDDMAEVLKMFQKADVLVLATPVYFYGISAQMKTFIDRTYPIWQHLGKKEVYYIISAGLGEDIIERSLGDLNGFVEHLEECKIAGKIYAASVDELSDKMSRKVCHEFLEEHPDITALYILNNSLCSGVLLDLKERQMKIPQDISLLVWDDEEYNELLDITTIEQPITEIGKQATRRLFELIGEPEETTDFECKKLDPELIIRKSCTLPKYRK